MPDLAKITKSISLIGIYQCAHCPTCRLNSALVAAVKTPTAIHVLQATQEGKTLALLPANGPNRSFWGFWLIRHRDGVHGEAGHHSAPDRYITGPSGEV